MYANIDDLRDLLDENTLIELTDDSGNQTPNEDIINSAISDASAQIDLFLSKSYDLPIESTPPILRKICVDITIYNLFSRKLQDEMPENIRKRYEDALSLLKSISAGSISIGYVKKESNFSGYVKGVQQVFNPDSLKGF